MRMHRHHSRNLWRPLKQLFDLLSSHSRLGWAVAHKWFESVVPFLMVKCKLTYRLWVVVFLLTRWMCRCWLHRWCRRKVEQRKKLFGQLVSFRPWGHSLSLFQSQRRYRMLLSGRGRLVWNYVGFICHLFLARITHSLLYQQSSKK